jgi:hypothetical protein
MKSLSTLLAASSLALLTLLPAPAETAPTPIEDLRKEYAESRKLLNAAPQPVQGTPGFPADLETWSDANRRFSDSAMALIPPLVAAVVTCPADEFATVRDELIQIHRDLVAGPYQVSYDNLAYFAQVIHPHVRDGAPAADRARFLAQLSTLSDMIRTADERIKKGALSEPLGWSIQDTHSLALARADNLEAARRESDLVLKKVSMAMANDGPTPIGVSHRGTIRSKASLYHELLFHRSLIEALAGDATAARAHLDEAQRLEEAEGAPLERHEQVAKEIWRRIEQ